MDRSLIAMLFVATAAAGACAQRELPPPGQVLLFVDTNAPVVLPPDTRRESFDPPGLFGEIRVEVLTVDGVPACADCQRDFPVDRQKLAEEATSVGIVAPPGRTDLRVRVRLFRALRIRGNGEPTKEGTIDELFELPPIGAEGIVEVTAKLALERVGQGPSPTPQSLVRGRAYQRALFPDSVPTGCAGPAGEGEVCVPGGAYWMSDADHNLRIPGQNGPERVVVLAPFWIDSGEVTVAQIRRSGLAAARDPEQRTDKSTCTYSAAPGATDDLPVTCITYDLASRYCASLGKALPTEAQFEYVASGLRGTRFPWGEDLPSCNDAIYARTINDYTPAGACTALGVGVRPKGSGLRDVLKLQGGLVFDLAGNAEELTRDAYEELEGPCWSKPFLVDPVCEHPESASTVLRGGGIESAADTVRATVRDDANAGFTRTHAIGFRCVRNGR